jgi:hypothetical protein
VIGALVLLLAGVPASPPPSIADYRKQLEEILSRREFRAVPRRSEPLKELAAAEPPRFFKWLVERIGDALATVFDWLAKWLFRDPGPDAAARTGAGDISRSAVYALGLGAAALLAVLLVRVLRRTEGRTASVAPAPPSLTRGGQPDALAQPAEAWARLADRFARTGEWRLALRAAFLELLVLLHERGAIRYERERTNGEYADALAGSPAGPPFRRLVTAFDEAWYGNRPFGEDAYRAAIGWARGVDQATARVPAAGTAP